MNSSRSLVELNENWKFDNVLTHSQKTTIGSKYMARSAKQLISTNICIYLCIVKNIQTENN